MAEKALDTRELSAALNLDDDDDDDGAATTAGPSSTSTPPPPPKPLTINDLPKEILVSVLIALNDQRWVRHNIPLVCKAWNEIFCSKDASPLHEALEVDFEKEVERAAEAAAAREEGARLGLPHSTGAAAQQLAPHRPVVHASRVISWAEKRASSVRVLDLKKVSDEDLKHFSSENLGALVRVVGPSLTEISIDAGVGQLVATPFWDSLRDSVVPAALLRSFVVGSLQRIMPDGSIQLLMPDVLESYVEPLAQLAGSLEELELRTGHLGIGVVPGVTLPRFPEALCALTELRRLVLTGHQDIRAIPAAISSLKKLKELSLRACRPSSLPKELGELSAMTSLDLSRNENLGSTGEAFPAELGKMKSLRVLDLSHCGLRAVPAFLGELKSLKVLNLSCNFNLQIDAPLDFLIEGCPRLRKVYLYKEHFGDRWTPESRAHLAAFKTKLLAKNPNAKVKY